MPLMGSPFTEPPPPTRVKVGVVRGAVVVNSVVVVVSVSDDAVTVVTVVPEAVVANSVSDVVMMIAVVVSEDTVVEMVSVSVPDDAVAEVSPAVAVLDCAVESIEPEISALVAGETKTIVSHFRTYVPYRNPVATYSKFEACMDQQAQSLDQKGQWPT